MSSLVSIDRHDVDQQNPLSALGHDRGHSGQIHLFAAVDPGYVDPVTGLLRQAELRLAQETDPDGMAHPEAPRLALEWARTLAERQGSSAGSRVASVALALFHMRRGAWGDAHRALRHVLAARPMPQDAALCHWLIGKVALMCAPPEEAIRRCAAALANLRHAASAELGVGVRLLASEAYLVAGSTVRARHVLDRARESLRLGLARALEAEACVRESDIHAAGGRWDAVETACRNALAVARESGPADLVTPIERRRAEQAVATGDVARARSRLESAFAAFTAMDEIERGRLRRVEARIALEEGDEPAAWASLLAAERSFRRMHALRDLADLLVLRAEAVVTRSTAEALRASAREGVFDARGLYRTLGASRAVTTCEVLLESLRFVRPGGARAPGNGDNPSAASRPRLPRTRRLTQFGFLTSEASILQAFESLESLARTTIPVLILGESGTGKEVLARALHRAAGGRGPFVPVNCGALPSELQESELFGHVRGAFTGAVADRVGLFEAADGGTLLLDEVGEMTPRSQVKLLRVLELGEVRRVGETRTRRVHVRVLAATNADLTTSIRARQFRQDLYYRLCGLKVELPPLRERMGDVPLLASHFVRQFRGPDDALLTVSSDALDLMLRHTWPGNVRELRFCVEKAVALTKALGRGQVEADCIEIERADTFVEPDGAPEAQGESERCAVEGLDRYLENLERRIILRALEENRWNRTHAARSLGGMSRTTLIGKMKRLGLFPEKETEADDTEDAACAPCA